MSLTLPNSYKRSNINENWLFQVFNSRDSFLSFDDVDDYIDYGTTPTAISNLGVSESTRFVTFSFWVKFPADAMGDNTYIFMSNTKEDHWSGFNIYKDQNDKISLLISDASENTNYRRISGQAINSDVWYHVAITSNMDGDLTTDNTKIYINNSSQTISSDGSGAISTGVGYHASGKTMFGKLLISDPDSFHGFSIKNFAIWSGNTALDSNNLTAIYNSGVTRSLLSNFGNYNQASALRAYWEFNNAETYSQDLTGNIAKGNIYGGTYGGFLPLAYKDTEVDGVFYNGSITQSGAIRDSIDLKNSKAKSSNISFQSANFKYKSDYLLKDLLFSDNYYINKTVRVFSQPDDNTSLSNCIQIYNGRLSSLNTNDEEIISFDVSSQRPWDFITIPKDQTPVTNTYIPLVYGDYTPNISFLNTPAFCDINLYPVPNLRINDDEIVTLMPRAYSSGSNAHINIYQGQDAFIPLATDSGSVDDVTTTQFENTNTIRTKLTKKAVGTIQGREATDTLASGTEFIDMHNAFDGASTTFSTCPVTNTTKTNNILHLLGVTTGISDQFYEHDIIKLFITHRYSQNNTSTQLLLSPSPYSDIVFHNVFNSSYQANTLNTQGFSITGTSAGNRKVSTPYKFAYKTFDTAGTISVNDVKVTIKTEFFAGSGDQDADDRKTLNNIEYFYSGGDGLTAINDWKTADSGLIKYGHEAHRDLLTRFTNFDFNDSDIYNWSSNLNVNSLRNNWSIRWWALEPVKLEKTLEEIQKEFGFIFKWRPDGSPSYWAIKNSYASGDVVTTIKDSDIDNLKISHTSFADLITKMNIKHKIHPATGEPVLSQESLDATTSPSPREKWNIKDKENIQSVELKYNYEKQGNEDVGASGSDPNDGYSDYYMNIFGDIKKVVSCSVVNPAKGYKLETGDIIQFDIDSVKPFGGDWNNYYMITSVQRSIGKINITCREVN